MLNLDSLINPKAAASIARRRRLEEERKKRLFDPRTRLIGIDVKALEKQIAEQKYLETEEKRRDEAFDKDRIHNDRVVCVLEQRLRQDKQQLEKKLNDFRFQCQPPEMRREFDLNDPDHLKKSMPARVSDDDPRLSLSGMQKFEGEDTNQLERAKLQKQQQHQWLLQQAKLSKDAEDMRNEANAIYDQQLLDLDRRAHQLQESQSACKKALDMAVTNFNKAMAKQMEQKVIFDKQRELEDNFAEISNAIFGDVLNDEPAASRTSAGTKPTSSNFRGFTAEQLAEIRRIQKEQMEEKKAQLNQDKVDQLKWDQYMETTTRVALLKEFQTQMDRTKEEQRRMNDNLTLAQEQKAFNDYLDRVVYVNRADEKFFDQFNRSAR